MAKIVIASEAVDDLEALYDWIARDSGVARADRVSGRLRSSIELLAEHPAMGPARTDLRVGVRAWSVRPWLIVYEPQPDNAGVTVLRVVDGRRDLQAVFGR